MLKAAEQITKLYRLFRKLDCVQLEINPFGETPDGRGKKTMLHIKLLFNFYFDFKSFVLMRN